MRTDLYKLKPGKVLTSMSISSTSSSLAKIFITTNYSKISEVEVNTSISATAGSKRYINKLKHGFNFSDADGVRL